MSYAGLSSHHHHGRNNLFTKEGVKRNSHIVLFLSLFPYFSYSYSSFLLSKVPWGVSPPSPVFSSPLTSCVHKAEKVREKQIK